MNQSITDESPIQNKIPESFVQVRRASVIDPFFHINSPPLTSYGYF